jgi:GTPase SAR1 family protein
MHRLTSHLHGKKDIPYVVNLDPAVLSVPFESNIDIRDSINYKEVMKQYNLGPNGGILTSLNLFATKIDQVLGLLEKRTAAPSEEEAQKGKKRISKVLVDTPGQIEVFVWSASGDILLGSLASSFPTVIAYVIDTPRTASTSTFMSNMLYACSILYKTKLPMILVFNKTDVHDAAFAKEWMTDFEAFQAALEKEEQGGNFGGADGQGAGSGYMSSLLHSMSLVLEEFYNHLSVVGVSAMTGDGIDEFFEAVEEKKAEFNRDYKPELEKRRAQRDKDKLDRRDKQLGDLLKDMNIEHGTSSTSKKRNGRKVVKEEPETVSDAEAMDSDEDEDEEGEAGWVDRDEDEDQDADLDLDEDDEDGLQQRYKKSLEESKKDSVGDEMSFVKYIHTANVG